MFPGTWAKRAPDRPAVIMAESGQALTFRELDERSCQLAQLFWRRGLRRGDHVAVLLENRVEFFEALWAALRSGLCLTTINRYLTVEEAAYILDDCEARALVTSASLAASLPTLLARAPRCDTALVVGGAVEGFEDYSTTIAQQPTAPLEREPAGGFMLYSSGTTGRPKGIRVPLPDADIQDHPIGVTPLAQKFFGFDETTVYLSTAPLYHAAPVGYTTAAHALGGTVVVLEHFDPVTALAAIAQFGVTHSQWVPTMFVRMLKLPEVERNRHDLSTHRVAIHAAAPCPRPVKEQMLEWWGPIIHEYYGGTETTGMTYVGPEDWLSHPGTVGRAVLGKLHICDESGADLPPGQDGLVYFERRTLPFEYHNSPEQTRASQHPAHPGWAALGDVGHVDQDGFLFLTDRATFMIVAGGVNIYPQEIEDVLVMCPEVADVAVIGVPNADLGEEVKAVVQLEPGVAPSESVATSLLEYAALHLARFKVPRSIDFVEQLPRLPTGKLYKRRIREPYWEGHESRVL
ncbi:MAG: AMP-binding protein [Acidimicrobiales bacterium]